MLLQKKNKVFFVLSLLFLVLAAVSAIFALVLGADLRSLGQVSGDNAIGAAAAGVVLAFLMVAFSIATWVFCLLSVLFSVLNLRTALLWLRVTSAIFSGAGVLLCVVTALSLLLHAG